eukprot:GHVS01086309.1.p1 GENE.GHVS01086309.1~~GHVS01086309.1.p1  ORF type:complete len:141 (-),score=22.11 GHVS01086309.1:194-592(-)
MPKYYCEYCDIYLTHSSPAGRRQHNSGRKHINMKVEYYQNLLREGGGMFPHGPPMMGPVGGGGPPGGHPTILRPPMFPRQPMMAGPILTMMPGGPMRPPHMSMPGVPPNMMPGHMRPPMPMAGGSMNFPRGL